MRARAAAPGNTGEDGSLPVAQADTFQASRHHRLAAFGFLLLAEFFYSWGWNTVDVLRPFFRDSLHLSLTQAGSAYSAQGAGALLGAIVMGQLADRFGRRPVLVVIMSGYGTFLLAGVLVTNYAQLLLQRFTLGLFLGGSFPVVVGIYVGLFRPEIRGRLASAVNATFSASVVALGFAFGHLGNHPWHDLLYLGGVPPILLAFCALAIIPPFPTHAPASSHGSPPILELFSAALRRQTLLLASLTGLNFFAYQAFSGWLTIYLKDVRHLPAAVVGQLVATQFAGNILGGFFWGWSADRFGRRSGAFGFITAATSIALYLTVPSKPPLLTGIGFLYGFCLAASVVWGPWMAELYPEHLRSTAASIFNWGRLISFFAPLLTAALASAFDLRASMMAASLTFLLAAVIWRRLPETLGRERSIFAS